MLNDVNDLLCTSLSKLETVLAQTVGGPLNGEPQTPLLSGISSDACLSLKLLL